MAISLRQGLVGIVAILGALSPLACSASADGPPGGNGKGESTGEDQSLLREGACMPEAIGSPNSCRTADDWNKFAAEACDARGLAVANVELGAGCDGGVSAAKYSCCKLPP